MYFLGHWWRLTARTACVRICSRAASVAHRVLPLPSGRAAEIRRGGGKIEPCDPKVQQYEPPQLVRVCPFAFIGPPAFWPLALLNRRDWRVRRWQGPR
jgi:hypothetical protein